MNIKDQFEIRDVRHLKGDFLPSIIRIARELEIGKGLCIIQNSEPIQLYPVLSELKYKYLTCRISETEYHIYFFRSSKNSTQLF